MGDKLAGSVCWVSGANKGIGEGIARLFASEGAKVAMIGLTVDEGERVAGEIREAGGECFFFRCDVRKEEDIKASIEETVRRYGTVNTIVNNAGIVDVKMLHEYTEAEWDAVMDLNVRAIFLTLKYSFPHLREHEHSYIVNMASVSSFVGQSTTPVYTTSKHAVLGLTKSIALDYARYGVRCNCVCPGITETPMLFKHMNAEKDPAEHYRNRLRRVPLGRQLYPSDIAKSVMFFSCEDSSGVTGASLVVDGGYLACAEWDTSKFE